MRAAQPIIQFVILGLIIGNMLGTACAGDTTNAPVNDVMEMRKKFADLSAKVNEHPEIRKLKAEMEAAQTAYQTAFETAMSKEDAGIMIAYRSWKDSVMGQFQKSSFGAVKTSEVSGYDKLTDDEKKQLFEVRKQAAESPAVKEARQKRNAATTEEQRKTAETDYKMELRKSMLGIDPDIAGLMDKLDGGEKPAKKNTAH